MIRRSLLVSISIIFIAGCVTSPANFKPAGFQSAAEAKEYVPNFLYFASKLSAAEWESFYRRFPEYWKDQQQAKLMGSTLEFHPWYTAYSFKWNTLRRKDTWNPITLSRLELGDVKSGDDIFQTVFSRGVPSRIIWDNDFEILLYKSGDAIVYKEGVDFTRFTRRFSDSNL